jgi:5-methylthioadenosine/S-adenosylhomocysteine deaminase
MKTGSLLQKVKQDDSTVAPAKEMFDLATKNGASALMMKSGQVKTGYSADLILIDLNQTCLVPGYNLISDLVYSCSGNCVSDLICEGKILMRDRKVPGENEIIKKVKNYGLSKG